MGLPEFSWGLGVCAYAALVGWATLAAVHAAVARRSSDTPSTWLSGVSPALALFLATVTGLALVCVALFALGVAGALTKPFTACTFALGLIGSLVSLARSAAARERFTVSAPRLETIVTCVAMLLLALVL